MNESVLCVSREEAAQKPVVGGEMAPVELLPPTSSDKKEEREPEAARGVELLCNYNMVLKSKYQALATSAGRQRKKVGGSEEKKIGKGS